jgi:hypothetical protein
MHAIFANADYYFCPTGRTWSAARAKCQTQLLGELVRIDDDAENTFITNNAGGASWIGATDASVEGSWRWIDNGALFWMGGQQGGLFNKWNAVSGEPNNGGVGGNEDCAQIGMLPAAGTWADQSCSSGQRFVCEVQADLCPDDTTKTDPGQCGCGIDDVHSDADGTADCLDECDTDPAKVLAGQCGCFVPETDADMDGFFAPCRDKCDNDPLKTEAGICGCGVSDSDDRDRDGTPDCIDACPYDDKTFANGSICNYPYTPSNFDETTITWKSAPAAVLDCIATVTIDTTDLMKIDGWCGELPVPVVQMQLDGSEVAVIPLASLHIARGTMLRLIGKRPAILAVAGDVLVEGFIDGRSLGNAEYGPGANAACTIGEGANGTNAGLVVNGAGGGGGGAFGFPAGAGGTGFRALGSVPGGAAGTAEGSKALVPLMGGCRGGFGGAGNSGGVLVGGYPGFGGGAVEISAAGLVKVFDTAAISASGGGGGTGNSNSDGGGGGGSGGAVLLEGARVVMQLDAWVTANGGGGGSGIGLGGNAGTDGYPMIDLRAPGGLGLGGGGNGGLGGSAKGMAITGGAGANTAGNGGGGGGGGGGGAGRIRVNGQPFGCDVQASFSPGISFNCPP